jgi:hypothetical protein
MSQFGLVEAGMIWSLWGRRLGEAKLVVRVGTHQQHPYVGGQMKRLFGAASLLTMSLVLSLGAATAWAEVFPKFLWSGTVGAAMAVKASGAQTITTTAGTIECKAVKLEGTIKSAAPTTLMAKGKYSECTAFGNAATVSEVTFEFIASEGVTIASAITVSVAKLACTVKIEPSSGKTLEPWYYSNSEKEVLATGEVRELSAFAEGGKGECGTEKTSVVGAEYSGNLLLSGASGTLSYDEGELGEFDGEGEGGGILMGSASALGANGLSFRWGNDRNFTDLKCDGIWSWANQAAGNTFEVSPSYPSNCLYGGAATVTVNAACRYRLNNARLERAGLNGNIFSEKLSIRGTGCTLDMKLESNVCDVKIASGAPNENLPGIFVENHNTLGSIHVIQQAKPHYTSAGCRAPIAANGTVEFLGIITLGGIILR